MGVLGLVDLYPLDELDDEERVDLYPEPELEDLVDEYELYDRDELYELDRVEV